MNNVLITSQKEVWAGSLLYKGNASKVQEYTDYTLQ